MTPEGRQQLTQLLARLAGELAADLQQKMLAPGPVQDRARRLHAEELVGDDYAVWTDLLSRRAAVLWILKSVYVRVLEDRGLLSPKRIVDFESQQLFEDRIAPSLGETAYLRWVYRDLAHALPELFSVQPAEVARPADALSRKLLELWRARDPDTGLLHHRFDEEHFDGELMGDLYQDLDPVVKDRYALLQTPAFVRDYILDHTLTPAIAEWGADKVRVLDPACGSGHFLLGAFRRLLEATAPLHPEWSRPQLVQQVLDRIVGIDLNDYACALARARLVMTALEACSLSELGAAGQFHPQVYWADALEQVERREAKANVQLPLLPGEVTVPADVPRAVMTRPEVKAALRPVLKDRFHVVVANPPYITEKDPRKKEYHREKVSGSRRYVSAYREYSLASPFTERCFQLAQDEGYVGLITSNNFMKREFGKPLIEEVLAGQDLFKVVDTAGAHIPGHGTPTVLLFARKRRPASEHVLAIMGRRGEPAKPADAAKGLVWTSIVEADDTVGYESEFVSVAQVARERFKVHPWSLGGGGAADLKASLDGEAAKLLSDVVEDPIGRGARIVAEEVFLFESSRATERRRFHKGNVADHYRGQGVRDWCALPEEKVWCPYSLQTGLLACEPKDARWHSDIGQLWRFRTTLAARATFQGVMRDAGRTWFEYMQFTPSLVTSDDQITFANVATHNHFCLVRGRYVFNSKAPVIKLPPDATEDDHLALLGLLNSSAACFWMKQVFQPKGGSGIGRGIQPERWMERHEFDGTKIKAFPVPASREQLAYAKALDAIARRRAERSVAALLEVAENWPDAITLRTYLVERRKLDTDDLRQMVALQEELDWLCYRLYDIDPDAQVLPPDEVPPLTPGLRPFEITLARRDAELCAMLDRGEEPPDSPTAWFERHGWDPVLEIPRDLPPRQRKLIDERIQRTAASRNLGLVEQPTYKRRWYRPDYEAEERAAMELWLADRIEEVAAKKDSPVTVRELAAALQADPHVLAVAELYTNRRDFDLGQLFLGIVSGEAVPQHPHHRYSATGLKKRAAWEKTWELQRQEDAGKDVGPIPVPPSYVTKDFLRPEYFKHRGKLDVPKERFIAFTEVPGRSGVETLYGWAGWTPRQRARALLSVDESLEDQGVPLEQRIGLLDTAWRLLPDVAREDAQAASQLKAELQALVGEGGPSPQQLAAWKERCPPPRAQRASRGRQRAETRPETDDEDE